MKLISIDVFHLDIAVFYTNEERVKHLTALGYDLEDEDVGAHDGLACTNTHPDGQAAFTMVIPRDAEDRIFVHESVHMADHIMDWLGILPDTEVRAYMTDYIFTEIRK